YSILRRCVHALSAVGITVSRGLSSTSTLAMATSAAPTIADYGSWHSNLTPEAFGQGNCGRIGELRVHRDSVFWIESNINTGKKELYQCEDGEAETIKRWADGMSVQNGVHEYGGGSYIVLPSSGGLLFSTVDGVWMQATADAEPVKVVDSEKKTRRFADFESICGGATPSSILAVEECHSAEDEYAEPANHIVAIDVATGNSKIVRSGADFYMQPRVSPCGRFASWMEWNHLNMPWDETTICVQELDAFLNGVPADPAKAVESGVWLRLTGVGKDVNYHGPSWSVDGAGRVRFHYTCDVDGHWNVYQVTGWERKEVEPNAIAAWAADEKVGGFAREVLAEPVNMLSIATDIGFPPWNFADPQFAVGPTHSVFNAQGTLYALKDGDLEPRPRDISGRVVTAAAADWNNYTHMAITDKGVVYCVAQGARRASTVLRIDLNTAGGSVSAVRHSRDPSSLEQYDITVGRRLAFTMEGLDVYGVYYPPYNRAYEGRPGTLPPVVVMGHSGPTLPTSESLDLKKQFLTSRGFAVFDVAYRGSSGAGRRLRSALYYKWGLADRDDLIAGAQLLCDRGLADAKRVCVWGSSATGFTALACALAAPSVFAAAVSIYGVADLEGLLKDTHKFEKGYNEHLVGRLPEGLEEFRKRSPARHVNGMRTPVVFLHGMEDTVVPVQQSIDMYKALMNRGVTTGMMLFEGEGHGFRSASTVKESTEAAYYFMCRVLGMEPSVESKLEIVNLKPHKAHQ
ncbi:hypothetical protein PFISCL1PPCAC_12361, partial [Pristionchus fissidentatus]